MDWILDLHRSLAVVGDWRMLTHDLGGPETALYTTGCIAVQSPSCRQNNSCIATIPSDESRPRNSTGNLVGGWIGDPPAH